MKAGYGIKMISSVRCPLYPIIRSSLFVMRCWALAERSKRWSSCVSHVMRKGSPLLM